MNLASLLSASLVVFLTLIHLSSSFPSRSKFDIIYRYIDLSEISLQSYTTSLNAADKDINVSLHNRLDPSALCYSLLSMLPCGMKRTQFLAVCK